MSINVFRRGGGVGLTLCPEMLFPAANAHKETMMQLLLRIRRAGEVSIVHGAGRIVYWDEASSFSCLLARALEHSREVVLDLNEVQEMDGCGLGALVLVHLCATSQGKALKLAGGSARVRELLELTRLSSVLSTYSSVQEAMASTTAPVTCTNPEFQAMVGILAMP